MKKGERRKQELLRIAYRLFLQKGYEETTVDAIIEEAGIAKGTCYYYFESKEQILEAVIQMMIEEETEAAEQVLQSKLPAPEKIMGVLAALRPARAEASIEAALLQPENKLLHGKVLKKLTDVLTPLLAEAVQEGIEQGFFACDNIHERVRMLLVVSSKTFDEGSFTDRDIDVLIDLTEKLLGAKAGSMGFIRGMIRSDFGKTAAQ